MIRFRRDLKFAWDRDHNVASLFLVSEDLSGRCVDAREISDELVLHYDGEGHCLEAEFLDPVSSLPPNATADTALRIAFEILASPQPPERAG